MNNILPIIGNLVNFRALTLTVANEYVKLKYAKVETNPKN